MTEMPADATRTSRHAWRNGAWHSGEREVAAETAIALTYDGATFAVMMATPADITDFALGFSLTEGIIHTPADIAAMEVMPLETGIDVRMWLHERAGDILTERRRRIAGPVGCGMCGLESLAQVNRDIPRIAANPHVTPDMVMAAIAALKPAQSLNRRTRAVHAAAFWQPGRGLLFAREDVGRHNALDKLAGALAASATDAASGIVLLSSRISVEMVQKAGMMGAPVVVAVSAPTALAMRVAEEAGITLVAVARDDGFEVFSREDRFSRD